MKVVDLAEIYSSRRAAEGRVYIDRPRYLYWYLPMIHRIILDSKYTTLLKK
eukprot:SAG11_NODE_13995_length_629_cov_1.262264_1_plen_50_part_10